MVPEGPLRRGIRLDDDAITIDDQDGCLVRIEEAAVLRFSGEMRLARRLGQAACRLLSRDSLTDEDGQSIEKDNLQEFSPGRDVLVVAHRGNEPGDRQEGDPRTCGGRASEPITECSAHNWNDEQGQCGELDNQRGVVEVEGDGRGQSEQVEGQYHQLDDPEPRSGPGSVEVAEFWDLGCQEQPTIPLLIEFAGRTNRSDGESVDRTVEGLDGESGNVHW